jgi:hypothetical protein
MKMKSYVYPGRSCSREGFHYVVWNRAVPRLSEGTVQDQLAAGNAVARVVLIGWAVTREQAEEAARIA